MMKLVMMMKRRMETLMLMTVIKMIIEEKYADGLLIQPPTNWGQWTCSSAMLIPTMMLLRIASNAANYAHMLLHFSLQVSANSPLSLLPTEGDRLVYSNTRCEYSTSLWYLSCKIIVSHGT